MFMAPSLSRLSVDFVNICSTRRWTADHSCHTPADERASLLHWLEHDKTSPVTREPLHKDLRRNYALKHTIEDWLKVCSWWSHAYLQSAAAAVSPQMGIAGCVLHVTDWTATVHVR